MNCKEVEIYIHTVPFYSPVLKMINSTMFIILKSYLYSPSKIVHDSHYTKYVKNYRLGRIGVDSNF